ncbi:MAG: hypothetical protein HYY15_04935 [Candidatus Omnitrophica bacterium]|nr:hypothetical protein [Candidatus Omnitrophota bacterium]
MKRRWQAVISELSHHLPYTIVSSLIAMAVVWYFGMSQIKLYGPGWGSEMGWSFHVLHPLHVCLSAITTTAVVWHFDRKWLKTVLIGMSSVVPCALSDYIVPFIGGRVLGQPMELHICLIDHPQLILPFLGLGILSGFLFEERLAASSVFSHGAHVFVASSAALLYLVSFGFTRWLMDAHFIFPVLSVVVLAVWIPCCLGDIVIPIGALQKHGAHGSHRAVPRPSL